jgi:hypothetical protein
MNQDQDFGGMLSYLLSLQKMMGQPQAPRPAGQQGPIPRPEWRQPLPPIQQRLQNRTGTNPMTPMAQMGRPNPQIGSYRPGQSFGVMPRGGKVI